MIRNRKQRVTEKYDTYYDAVLADGWDIPITSNELVELVASTSRSRNFVLEHEFLDEELKRSKFSKPKFVLRHGFLDEDLNMCKFSKPSIRQEIMKS